MSSFLHVRTLSISVAANDSLTSPPAEQAFHNLFASSLGCRDRSGGARSRPNGRQQHGGSSDQEVAGGSDPERRIDADGNAGCNGKASGEDSAAPLMPQNHGVGVVLIAETNRMPVGKPKPIRRPAGARTRTQTPARMRRSAASRSTRSGGNQSGNANK
jgi:hypothetical protein